MTSDHLRAYGVANAIGGNRDKYNDVQNIINSNNNNVVHSASEQKQKQRRNNNENLKYYALVNAVGSRNSEALQTMIEESAYQTKVLEDITSKKEQGQVHQASQMMERANYSGKSNTEQILKHYKLVQMIASRSVDI